MPRKTKMNKITSPELLARVNPDNRRLQEDFLNYLQSIGRSNTTIAGYTNDLDIFMVWNLQNNNNKHFVSLTKRDVISYQNWLLNENENSSARIRRLKSVLSSLSNFIESVLDDEFENYRPIIRKIESPVATPVREKTVLSEEQVDELLAILVEKKQYQKACAVALAAYSGARKSELTRFKVSYFTEENIIFGSLYKTPEKIKTKGRGTSGKLLHKYVIVDKFKPYLDLWLEQRKELGIDSEWLFVTLTDGNWKQTNPETLNSWALTNSRILGVDFYFHSLRHFFTTMLSRLGLPDDVIKEIVGWGSLDLVLLYKDIDADEMFEKYFDENGIKAVESKSLNDLKA